MATATETATETETEAGAADLEMSIEGPSEGFAGDDTDEGEDEEDDGTDESTDEGEDEEPGLFVEWLDGVTRVFTEFGDKKLKEILEDWLLAKRKGHTTFVLGQNVIDPTQVRHFGWSEDTYDPDTAVFNSLQERVEAMIQGAAQATLAIKQSAQGIGTLIQQQAALQQAQGQLFEAIEAEAALEDEEEDDEEEPKKPGLSGPLKR